MAYVHDSGSLWDQAVLDAAKSGNADELAVAVWNGGDIFCRDHFSRTVLMMAAEHGHVHIVELVYNMGLNPKAADSSGRTALHFAAEKGHKPVLAFLLGCGVNVNVASCTGETALSLAVGSGHVHSVKFLLSKKAPVSWLSRFSHAVKQPAKADVTTVDGETPLMQAAAAGCLELVRLLLSAGASANAVCAKGQSALMRAVTHGYADVVEKLLNDGAEVNSVSVDGDCSLLLAVKNQHWDIAHRLILAGADTDSSVLWVVKNTRSTDYPGLANLLAFGASANAKDRDGVTALMWAVRNSPAQATAGNFERGGGAAYCGMLVEENADVNARDNSGATALMNASVNKLEAAAIIVMLIAAGADVHATTLDGKSAVILATECMNKQAVTALVSRGADVDSAFLWAVSNGSCAAVRLLLDEGADVNVTPGNGPDAKSLALRRAETDIAELLISRGARGKNVTELQAMARKKMFKLSPNDAGR